MSENTYLGDEVGAALTDLCSFVDLMEARAMACDGPVTPFIDELVAASASEKERFTRILSRLYSLVETARRS